MKQVYKTENLTETTTRTTYFRGGVLFVGFVVWLMAVTDSFGQNGRQNDPGPSNVVAYALTAQVMDDGSIVIHKPGPAARVGPEADGEPEGAFSFGLKAYPNPSASGIFRVSAAEEMTRDALMMVTDAQGQSVYSGVLEAGSRTLEIDLLDKQSGIYLLHLRSGANREVINLVKP